MPTSDTIVSESNVDLINRMNVAAKRGTLGTLLQSLEARGFKYFVQEGIVPADFSNQASTEGHFAPSGFPTNAIVQSAFVLPTVNFTGGSVSAATLSVGDADDRDGLAAAASVFATAGAAQNGIPTAVGYPGSFRAEFVPTVTLTTTGDNIDQLTDGDATLYIIYLDASPLV